MNVAFEDMAVALAESGAVPRQELIRALERAAERLRTGPETPMRPRPADLVTQSEAARAVNVSRQAVHQWVAKGLLAGHPSPDSRGRPIAQVSLSEVAAVANRSQDAPLPASLRRQFDSFLGLLEGSVPSGLIHGLVEALDPPPLPARDALSSQVLREFITEAMSSTKSDREFSREAVQMLGALPPLIGVDRESPFGRLAATMNLLITSSDGTSGFDSPGLAVVALLAEATVGASLEQPEAKVGLRIAGAAESVWGAAWIDRLFDLGFHLDERASQPLSRYTSSLSHLTPNRFFRSAQASGVSISYGRSPGLLLPHSYFGDPLLRDMLAGRTQTNPWTLSPTALRRVASAAALPELNPFRMFTFEKGLLDSSISGVRRYVYCTEDARRQYQSYASALDRADRSRYRELAVGNLARAIETKLVYVVAVDRAADFDWWKDHTIRASAREVVIGLRGARARSVAHAIRIQPSIMPRVVEAARGDVALRERLRIYVKNLDFDVVDDRYRDDLRRGVSRVVSTTTADLDRMQCEQIADQEIQRLAN